MRKTEFWTVLGLSALALAIHLAVNAFGGYGYFRDELYYIACSRHPAAGYVDQPPLSLYLLAGVRFLIGDSVFAIRLVPALLAAVSTALVCLLARRLGGGRPAVVLSALAFLCSPYLLAFHSYYSMNSFDVLFWLLAAHALMGAIEQGDLRSWLLLGLALGLGLLNKTSVLWLCTGVFAAVLLCTPLRRQLRTPGPYAAGVLALAVFSPFVIWNALNGWPHLEFIRNATEQKYASLTRVDFLVQQFLAMNPFSFLVSLPGLAWCLASKDARRRPLGIVFLTVMAILVINPHTKAEYAMAAYPMLFACGGVALEQWRRKKVVLWVPAALLGMSGAVLAPVVMPILPVNVYARYTSAIGVEPGSSEGKELAELPQFFADMHGWEELARNVSAAFVTIPEAERATTVAFVTNYGEAAALELYADRYPLPRVICNHNAYWFWGTGSAPITTFIRLGGNREDYLDSYGDVVPAGVHTCEHCMPYENNQNIFIVRQRRVPIEKDWAEYRNFQ
jgi:hypothetical protein